MESSLMHFRCPLFQCGLCITEEEARGKEAEQEWCKNLDVILKRYDSYWALLPECFIIETCGDGDDLLIGVEALVNYCIWKYFALIIVLKPFLCLVLIMRNLIQIVCNFEEGILVH